MIGPATLATLRVAAGARAPIVGGDWSELPSCAPFRVAFPVTGLLVRHFHGDAEHARFLGRIANTTRSTLHRTMTTAVGIAATAVAVLDFPAAFPLGGALIVVARRAVQLGMRGKTLARYTREWIVRIDDVTDFVRAQRECLDADRFDSLALPVERVYPCTPETALALGLDIA